MRSRPLGLQPDVAPAQARAALSVVGDPLPEGFGFLNGPSDAIVTGGVAAIEAVAGRAARLMSMATVEGRLAQSVLTPVTLAMIAGQLVRTGGSLHWLDIVGGRPRIFPAEWDWSVYGPMDERKWFITASVPGGQTTYEREGVRDHWLYILQNPEPAYPWLPVPAASRAGLTHAILTAAEGALRLETRQPTKTIVAFPDGTGEDLVEDVRAKLLERTVPVILPPTTSRGFGSGASNAPQADWVPRRMQPAPDQSLLELASRAGALIVAALGGHPSMLGGASGAGAVSREARRQFREVVLEPLARLIEYETSMTLGEDVRLRFAPDTDSMLVIARTEHEKVKTEKLRREMVGATDAD